MILDGCASTLLTPTEFDSQRASLKWSDMNLEKMQTAHRLYINKCGNCHFLYRPNRFSEEKWRAEMPDMKKEAKLNDEQIDLITKYILVMREAVPSQKSSP